MLMYTSLQISDEEGESKLNYTGWKPNKHIAQGSALGVRIEYSKTPRKGKSIDN